MAGNESESKTRQDEQSLSSEKSTLRLLQRNAILGEFDTRQIQIIHRLFPDNILLRNNKNNIASKPNETINPKAPFYNYLDNLMLLFNPFEFDERDGGYSLLFRLACTAQTPEELSNIFHGIKTLEQLEDSEFRIYDSHIRPSRNILRNQAKTVHNANLSKEAQWIYSEMERVIGQAGSPLNQMKALGKEFFNPDSKSFNKYKNVLAEVYLYLTLNGDFNDYWNELFLYGTRFFQFGEERPDENKLDLFNEKATFWKQVDGSWAGIAVPDEFATSSGSNIGQSSYQTGKAEWFYEKAGLEKRIRDLEASLHSANDRNLVLSTELDILKAQIRELERRNMGSVGRTTFESTQQTGDAVDTFLATYNYTKDTIGRMTDETRRRDLVSKLKRLASMAYHPHHGLNPDEARLVQINTFLNQFNNPQEPDTDPKNKYRYR